MRLGQVVPIGPLMVQPIEVFFQYANTDVGVPHSLPVAPIGWIPIRLDKHCRIKDSQMPPAKGAVQLVSDTDGVTARILVISLNLPER